MDFENIFTKLKRPSKIEYIQNEKHKNTFTIKPVEKGMGHTLANSLRRVLLSSLEGYSIVVVKFSKANNIYQNLTGVYQDTIEICAHLKNVAIWSEDNDFEAKKLTFKIKGEKKFYAKDIVTDNPELTVGDPNLLIFEANQKADFTFDLYICKGFGYVESGVTDKMLGENMGEIVLDADFTPVKNVNFSISDVTLNGVGNYEKINLTIETKQIGDPKLFLANSVAILNQYYSSFDEIEKVGNLTEVVKEVDEDKELEEYSLSEESSVYQIKGLDIPSLYFLYRNRLNKRNDVLSQSEDSLRNLPFATDEVIEIIKEKIKEEK